MNVEIYRYSPEQDQAPWLQVYHYNPPAQRDVMVLDVLEVIKERDPSLSYRRSCREGVCGSDGMNMNGRNGLACITPLSKVAAKGRLRLRPLPGLPVIRDLVVDMAPFWRQYERIRPWLISKTPAPGNRERLQSPEERARLDGLYECILCACCTTACPSWWWNPDSYLGPAALLQANRFVQDSRDEATEERLDNLKDHFSLFRCRGIANCDFYCPKGLLPKKAISTLKRGMIIKD